MWPRVVISEARLASRLNHPNIVTVYELIDTPWGLAIAMELVDGQSLRKAAEDFPFFSPAA